MTLLNPSVKYKIKLRLILGCMRRRKKPERTPGNDTLVGLWGGSPGVFRSIVMLYFWKQKDAEATVGKFYNVLFTDSHGLNCCWALVSTKRTFPHLSNNADAAGWLFQFDGLGKPAPLSPNQPLCAQTSRRATPPQSDLPWSSRWVRVAPRVGGPPTWKRACSPRNGLQWSVKGQILAFHITGDEKMSVCFLYLMQKNYLNLWNLKKKHAHKKNRLCVLVGREVGPIFAEGACVWRRDFCAWPYCGCLNSFQMGLSFLFSPHPHPPTWQRAPFSYFTCCDFTEPFQLVVNSSFVPGPSINSARGSPGLTTHRNRLSKQRVSGPQTQQVS